MSKFSCLIPFKDEGERPLNVIEEIIKVQEIDEIVCVDASKNDFTKKLILKFYPNIKFMKQAGKIGQAEAINIGTRSCKNEHIIILDADVRNFKAINIKKSLNLYTKNKLDMVILKNTKTHLLEKILRGNVLVVGERILSRKSILSIFKELKPEGYQFQIASNYFMMKHLKSVCCYPHGVDKYSKEEKSGFWCGLVDDIRMQINVIGLLGVFNWIYQYLFFARKICN